MKTIRLVSNGWLWFYVASWMLFVSFIALGAGWSSIPPSQRYLSPRFTASLAVFLLLLSFVSLISGTLLYALKSRRALLAPALFLPTFGCMFVSLAFLGPDAFTLVPRDSKYLNGQLYELDSYGLSDFETPYGSEFATTVVYILYECDTSDIGCRTLYRQKFDLLRNSDLRKDPFLSIDSGQLTVHIGGQIVYMYPP